MLKCSYFAAGHAVSNPRQPAASVVILNFNSWKLDGGMGVSISKREKEMEKKGNKKCRG